MVADIEKALKYPLNFKPLFILGILFLITLAASLIPAFFLSPRTGAGSQPDIYTPLFAVYFVVLLAVLVFMFTLLSGYMVSVSKSIIAGNLEKAPEITGIGSMLVNGLKFIVIALVYAVPPSVFMLLTIAILKIWGLLLMFAYFPLFYVFHLASAHLAYTGSLKKALDIPRIYSLIFRNPKGFILGFFFYFVATIVYSFAGILIVTYPFLIVACYVVGQYIFTIFYMEASGLIEENKL